MRHILLTISLIFGATAVSANTNDFAVGDVFFCEGVLSNEVERFKFTIKDKKTIKFGSGGYFNNFEMQINEMITDLLEAASQERSIFVMGNDFFYTKNNGSNPTLINATCDRF